jgi:hypothetical protein
MIDVQFRLRLNISEARQVISAKKLKELTSTINSETD